MSSQAKRGGSPSGQGPRVGHLDTLTGILKEMGNVYREMRYATTPIADGTKLIFSLKCMRDVIETIALERLEQRMNEIEDRTGSRMAARAGQHETFPRPN
jgi:hypothetical protein